MSHLWYLAINDVMVEYRKCNKAKRAMRRQ
jgi:hypothetical protein